MHYADVIMTKMASQITSLTVVYSTVYSDADQIKYQSSASLAFVWGIHRDRWIPRTKGQLRGKCFHLMTSSWIFRQWHLRLNQMAVYRQHFQIYCIERLWPPPVDRNGVNSLILTQAKFCIILNFENCCMDSLIYWSNKMCIIQNVYCCYFAIKDAQLPKVS